MICAGIIGGAGYTAGELIRILLNHPQVEISFVHSTSNAGNFLYQVHEGLIGDTDMRFTDAYDFDGVDVLFLCSGHGVSQQFLSEVKLPERVKIIDLAQDFRDESCDFVYGLPEINAKRIARAQRVANPGCFATAIQLALLPLAAAGEIKSDVCVTAITGSTGAGVKPGATTHFSWRDNNISVYKAFSHQHMAEIMRTLTSLQPKLKASVDFVPVRGDFPRGIFAMSWLHTKLSDFDVRRIYADYYADAVFTHYSHLPIDLKQVVNTNKALIALEMHDDKLLITSAIDNLLKGASGQAVQNMNIMFGLPEDTGLKLKPSAF